MTERRIARPFTIDPRPAQTMDAFFPWLLYHLDRIAASTFQAHSIHLTTSYTAPSKPSDGMIVLADGTEWNPGSGAGYYGYYGGNWVKLG